ncbi:MAG: DUF1559 domain-containing protein [Planctomycetales bacterium]|nr:DUF1559 domain-containing protein [Planctomycetales bacterium]
MIAIIGVLVALLLPAIQAAREAARRATCQNNLRQVALALIGHEDVHKQFPMGVRAQYRQGISWWIEILPFIEEEKLYEQYDGRGRDSGYLLAHQKNAELVDELVISALRCPSSPIPPLYDVYSRQVMMPSYVGISGASSHDGFPESRVNTCCVPKPDGEISGGGILVPNKEIKRKQLFDGASKTIFVGESSDFAIDKSGAVQRIDGGFASGWVTGTSAEGTPPNYEVGTNKPRPCWNITTVRYSPNTRDYELPGIFLHGANNPLLSPHPSGVHAAFADGAVQFIEDDIDLLALKRLSTRDDGGK